MWGSQTGTGRGEYVHKHSDQLVCACSEDGAGDLIWAGCFASIHMLESVILVGHRDRELTIIFSSGGPRRRISIVYLEASIKSVQLV